MGILRLGHRHISRGTLNEYLDGRLTGPARGRVERITAECPGCREELESLRQTMLLLNQLPELTPRRSFVLTQVPLEIPFRHARPWFQVPQWAYAGAASMAALALALLITMDVTGLVAPDLKSLPAAPVAPAESQVEIITEAKTVLSQEAAQGIEAAPVGPEIAQAVQAESAAPAVAEPPVMALQAEAESPPEPQTLPSAAPKSAEPPDGAPDAAATGEATERSPVEPQQPDGDAAAVATPLPEQPTPPVFVIEPTPGTPLFWRVLEGLAAALALALLAALIWKRRATNRF